MAIPRARRLLIALAIIGLLAFPASASALTDYTWTGNSTSSQHWSDTGNWQGGAAPAGSVGTLNFPVLSNPPCNSSGPPGPPAPGTPACYSSNNDQTGITANGLTIDLSGPYNITGNSITLNGGITASSTSGLSGGGLATLGLPIVLGADQTWSINGVSTMGVAEPPLEVAGNVSGSHNLSINLTNSEAVLFGDPARAADVEVGTISVTGSGNSTTVLLTGGSLNGTNGNGVNISTASFQVSTFGSPSTGALSLSGGSFVLGGGNPQVLSVNGGLTLASTTNTLAWINETNPGPHNSQANVTGNVTLSGALTLIDSGCSAEHVGDTFTLGNATGTVSGTFTGVPDGTVIPMGGCGASPGSARINYTAHTVTATITSLPGSSGGMPTSTSLAANPASAVTNQAVTLTATVNTGAAGNPTGTVEFDNHGSAIPGCTGQPVDPSTGRATCQTSFPAASSPESLTASYSGDSTFAGSSSKPPTTVTVTQDSTSTSVSASNTAPQTGQSVTYTATVAPAHAGPTEPSGTVTFLDGGAAIPGCSSQPLTAGASASTATCTVTYSSPGSHSISASYGGDANFTGSASASQSVTVSQSSPPAVSPRSPNPSGSTRVTLSDSVNPQNSPTTAYYQYGIDPSDRGPGSSSVLYDQRTPSQAVGSDASGHTVTAVLSGLVPNTRYHFRLVATNGSGTTFGPDQVFTTPRAPVSPTPPVGSETFTPSGTVFVKINGKFVKLTQTMQLPSGTEVDALHGSLSLIANGGRGNKFSGTFSGAVFTVIQPKFGPNRGLTTIALADRTPAFPGAPSYATTCRARGAADLHAERVSRRVIYTLRSRSRGSWSSRGRSAAGTVGGTVWTTTDRCDGTLITAQVDNVLVTDLVRHIKVLLHPHQHYLARRKK